MAALTTTLIDAEEAMAIHQTAVVDPTAELGEGVEIGPFSIIEGGVTIGDGCRLGPHCVIRRGVTLGSGCRLDVGVVLGSEPQDAKFQGEESFVHIGNNNVLREYVTIHRATGEGEATTVGDDNFIMAYAHLGHNTRIGSGIMIASLSAAGGHCVIHDHAIVGGVVGLHQYVTVGRMSIVGGCSRVVRDVPPFTTAAGNPARPRGINVIGLSRHGVSNKDQQALRRAFREIYVSDLNTSDAIESMRRRGELTGMVREFVEFVERMGEGSRGRQEN